MATVTRENIGTLHDKLTIKLEKGDYMKPFEDALKKYAKTANVPGFRKGMVPAGMIRRMYGHSIFNEEVTRTAGREMDNYLRTERIAIFAQPMFVPNPDQAPLDMNNPADVNISFEIGVKPDFNIPAIDNKAKLPRYKVTVTDEMVDHELELIKRKFGTIDEQVEVSDKENVIFSTFEACNADGNVHAGATKLEDTRALMNLPAKLGDMLMGKVPGDSLVITPVDVCSEEELGGFMKNPLKAGSEAVGQHYKMTITKVGRVIPADMGMELYAKVLPNVEVKDEVDFGERIRTELEREYNRIAGERLQNEIFELLVHSTEITLPVPFLKRWLREGGEKPKSAQEVENEFGSFEHQLRWQLISDKVMIENNINVTREEIEKDVKGRVLNYFGLGPDDEDEAPWMDSYMSKLAKDEKMMEETYRRILFAKLFVFLETQFTVEEVAIDEKDFFKLGSPHEAHHHHH